MGSVCHRYMCILLYLKLIGCNGVAQIYAHLDRSCVPLVYVHSLIGETYLVSWCCVDLCSFGGGWVSLP